MNVALERMRVQFGMDVFGDQATGIVQSRSASRISAGVDKKLDSAVAGITVFAPPLEALFAVTVSERINR